MIHIFYYYLGAALFVIAIAADGHNLYLTTEDGQMINFVNSTSNE